MLKIPRSSVEYVHVDVVGSGTLTALPVSMAILPEGQDPVSGDWKTAAWVGDTAQVLVGPSQVLDLAKGTYMVWVKVTSTPEIPVLQAGRMQII